MDCTSSVQATLAQGYMPYGEPLWSVGSGSSAYGFTGEDWNTTIQLVFLRARYMQPGLGMFLSRDPWSGDDLRPGSMNGWNYVECRPVNSIDPSGRIPTPNFGSGEGQYEYSCNCGWIDWNHASPGLAKDIIGKVRSAQGRRNGPTPGTFIIPVRQGDMFGNITGNIEVSTNLWHKSLIYDVSLGIYMELQELLEWYQSGVAPIPYLPLINISGFSQEDLMSDLLGFKIAYQADNENPHPDPKGNVRRICDVVGLDEPDYQQKQMSIYIKHFPSFTTNMDWFNPLVGCSVCEPDPNVVKYMFDNLSPVRSSPTGPWRWVSAQICNLIGPHFCGSYYTDYLNNRGSK